MTTLETFEDSVARLFKRRDFGYDLIHATVGITSEAGEIATTVKRHWAYETPLHRDNLLEEIGDLMFFATALAHVCDFSLDQVLQANVAKLSKRYPLGEYSNEQALDRADKAGES
jgi:NTP pyrophosphatase (non-canonical NTP hydrolase)